MTRRDQEERIDAPLADLRENQVDERHESWKSMHFESHKNSYWLRWKNEILQVVPSRARLHRNCDAALTRHPRPPHVNVGFKRAPEDQGDKITQVNIEMWEGEVGSELGGERFSLAFAFDALNVTCDISSPHCVCYLFAG